jgi:hypothetical protein
VEATKWGGQLEREGERVTEGTGERGEDSEKKEKEKERERETERAKERESKT